MRVLHVITDTERRGAQVFALDLARLLERTGGAHSVVALTPGGRGARLAVETLGPSRFSARTLAALRRRIRGADVVIAHGSSTLPACTVAGWGLGRPLVYRNISDPAYWLDRPSRRWRVAAMLRRTGRVVALWPGGAGYLSSVLGIAEDGVVVIPNGVPVNEFRPATPQERRSARERFGLPTTAPVLLFPAALQPEKHPDTAVRALADLPEDVHLLVMGEGPMREEVTRLATATAPGRVVVAGRIADPVTAYWAADLVVLPSEGEGLPAVLIEASLCEVPCVASTSGGNASIVLDGETGAIVPPADPAALARAVEQALPQQDRFGPAARAHCLTTFGMETVSRQWDVVITELAG